MTPDDLDRELRNHLEFEAEEQRDRGLSANDAAFAARRTLGRTTAIREDVRTLSPLAALDDCAQDLRYGLRLLRKHPGFAVVAALTLALGVGATTAIFSVVEAVLLRPLPYRDADRLAMVWENVNLPAYKNAQNAPAPGNFRDWRDQNASFIDLAAMRDGAWSLTGTGEPIRVTGEMVSASLFGLLGVDPHLGRRFTPDDDRFGAARVVVLGHGLWVDRFGSNPSTIGATIHVNDEPHTVIGVMPRAFRFPDHDDQLWLPLALPPQQYENHGSHFLRVLGRLEPGVTLAQAQGDLDAIAARLTAQFPDSNTGVGVAIVPLREQTVGDVRRPLLVILGIVAFVLLMVCTNIGNLLLARATARGREFAVRAALGADRVRLMRQLLAEGLLLAAIGGALGLALAWGGVSGLRWLAPADLPRIDEVGVNTPVATFNFLVAALAGLLCAAMPALRTQAGNLYGALRDEGRVSAEGARLRARNLLITVQTALGVIVLVAAGLLLRSFVQLTQVPVGFDDRGLLSFRVTLPEGRYRTESQRIGFYKQVADKLQSLPGVQSVAAITSLPLGAAGSMSGVWIEGDRQDAASQVKIVDVRSVSPGYFTTLSIPTIAGRDVAWSDAPSAPSAIVVSETLARSYWPNQNPIGKRLKFGRPESPAPWRSVVGVVGDVRQVDLVRMPRPAVYVPALQDSGTALRDWIVRTSGDVPSLAPAVRKAVWAVDPLLPVSRVQTMTQVRSAATAAQQFNLLLVGLLATLALVLAALGLYGVTAYTVSQRTRELGIRIALGAERGRVLRLVLKGGTRPTVVGLGIGLLSALALTHLMASLLFGVEPRDPVTFAGVCVVFLVVSLAATLVPALRATRVDPVIALRS